MSEVEDFLSQMLPRFLNAADAMHHGDPAGFVELWSRRDPVTLLGAADTMPPGWLAVTEHVPAPTSAIWVPSTVHTASAFEVRVTGRPELAVAEAVTGDWASVFAEIDVNVIDWLTWLTVNERVTEVAGRQSALPAWLAVTVQVPGPYR